MLKVISVKDVVTKLQEYVDNINLNIHKLETRGHVSKYVLPDDDLRGRGYHVLSKATEVVGHVKPYSITGSLPLIRELQDEGFDVQTAGYGLMATYHAQNEYCLFTDMSQGYRVFASIIAQLEED
ncbi:hypothetical protein AHAS_Ahas05G0038900 [Arachis hypogaea]|nr:acetylornithine deacetylase-like [Arachis hypogaea]